MANDVESRLISKIINSRNLSIAVRQGVKSNFFTGDNRQLWSYICSYYSSYKEVPDKKTVKRRFIDFKFDKTSKENYDNLVVELKNKVSYKIMVTTINEATKELPNSTSDAYKILLSGISEIQTNVKNTDDADWIKSSKGRLKEYYKRYKQKVFGIPTYWKTLDKIILGFQDSHLITLAGRPAVGKSWISCICAYKAWLSGHRVLFVTKEMDINEIQRRLDAIHGKIGYEKFRTATLDRNARFAYKVLLKRLEKSNNTIIVSGDDSADSGVLSLNVKIEEYDPDIVFLDGAYLLSDDKDGKSKTERIYNITQDMKKLSRKLKLPIIQTTQMGRSATEEGTNNLSKIQSADSFAQDSDEVIEVYAKSENPCKMFLRVLKQREGQIGIVEMNWDLENMDFEYIDNSESDANFEENDKSNTEANGTKTYKIKIKTDISRELD